MFDDLKNLYEVRKTVRFELKPYRKTREVLKWNDSYDNLDAFIKHIKEDFQKDFNWNEFCKWQYQYFLDESRILFDFISHHICIHISDDDWNIKTTTSIQFNFKWLKGIFKNIPALKKCLDFKSLMKKILEIEEEYSECFRFFEMEKERKNEKQSDISEYLRKIAFLNRNTLTIFQFLWNNQERTTDEHILKRYQAMLSDLWETFEKLNNTIIASHQNETTGACFGKFTFNKYALFRREAEDLKEKYKQHKQKVEKYVDRMIQDEDFTEDNGRNITIDTWTIHKLVLKKENSGLQSILKTFNFHRDLDEVISELDEINGNLLNQYIQEFQDEYKKDTSIIDVEFHVFKTKEWREMKIYDKTGKPPKLKELFDRDYNATIKVQPWQTLEGYEYLYLIWKENTTWEEKKKQKLANKFLRILFKQEFINSDFNTIKKFRDALSRQRGKIRQDVRTSGREFIQEAMIRYYGNILEKDWYYFLALTRKEDIPDNSIENITMEKYIRNMAEKWDFSIFLYSQLSFRSLEKLCLMEDGDLIIHSELTEQWNKYKNQKKDIEWGCRHHKTSFDKYCEECNLVKEGKQKQFLERFRDHIVDAIEKLRNDSKYKGEDWSIFIPEIEKLSSIEKIVHFIDEKFYKLKKKYINANKVFELAEQWKVLLFQLYNKDFSIYDENFVSHEERLEENEHWEATKMQSSTKRASNKQPNLFTLYWKEIFQLSDTSLWQEGGIFFRKADTEKIEKRFRNNKFFWAFDVRFNKWKVIAKTKLCEKKEKFQQSTIDAINIITKRNVVNNQKIKENIVFVGIDRGKKEHLSIGFYDNNLNHLWIIGNTNFVKKIGVNQINFSICFRSKITYFDDQTELNIYKQIATNEYYFDEYWKVEEGHHLELLGLRDYHVKRIFTQDINGNYFVWLKNGWRFILNKWKYWYKIVDKDNNELVLHDTLDGKEIIDYYLLFESERYKRILDINSELQYSTNMKNLKKWYIAIVKDFFKQKIQEFSEKWKEIVFALENQSTNKGTITKDYKGASIISEIEEELLNSFVYLKYKAKSLLNGIQLGITIKKDELNTLSKSGKKTNAEYGHYWHFLFVNPDFTSEACPVCNKDINLFDIDRWNDKEENKNNQKSLSKLYWHWKWKLWESNMHHCDNPGNCPNIESHISTQNTSKCDYHMKDNRKWFDFLTSWDDLATYNIAKKAKEYLEFLSEQSSR